MHACMHITYRHTVVLKPMHIAVMALPPTLLFSIFNVFDGVVSF